MTEKPKGCGFCGKVRSYAPEGIRLRLEAVEKRMAEKRQTLTYPPMTIQVKKP